MNARGFGLTLLVLCIAGGLVAAIFSPALAATLTLPATPGIARTTTTSIQVKPTAGTTPTPPAVQPTQVPDSVMLAHDTFQRPNQQFWGTSSDGRIWGSDANHSSAFAIVNHTGEISGGTGVYEATLDAAGTDTDLLFSGTVSVFDAAGNINLGGVLRWQDTNNWYKVLINSSELQLLKDVNGTVSVLQMQKFQAIAGTNYTVHFRIVGSNLFANAWPSDQAEPANWMLVAIDTSLTIGSGGIRVKLLPGAVIRITSFVETSVSNTM
jgi:hypothetical protein